MSALLLASASSDASSPGSHANIQPRRNSSNSGRLGLSDTAAFALKSFLLDEEIRLQQQRLQHMLHLRQQQLQEQSYAHLEQEIDYKNLILQQRFLTLTGEQQLKGQTFPGGLLQLPLCAAGNPPAVPVAISDDDTSMCIEREHPHHVLQRTDEQLSVSQLQLLDNSDVNCSDSRIAEEEASSLTQQHPLQQQIISQPRLNQPVLKQNSLPQQLVRQHHIQGPALQHFDVQQAVLQQRKIEQREGENAFLTDQGSPEQPALQQQAVQHHTRQQKAPQETAATGWRRPAAAALQTPSKHFALTNREADFSVENRASGRPVDASSVVSCGALPAEGLCGASPSCRGRRISQREARAQREAGRGLHVGSVLLQNESLTPQNPSAVSGGATAVAAANPATPLQVRSLEDEESAVSTCSREPSSIGPLASASARSFAALDHAPGIAAAHKRQEQRPEQMPSEPCSTACGERGVRYSSLTDGSMREENCAMEHSSSVIPGGDKTPSAEAVRVAQYAGAAAAEQTTSFPQTEMQNAQAGFAYSSRRQRGGSLRSVGTPLNASTEPASGEAYQPAAEGGEQGALANDQSNDDVTAADASTERDLLQKGKTSFSRLDLSLAVSQQLRSSHVARGTESATVEEVEEMLQKCTTQKGHCLLQQHKHACGSIQDEVQGCLTGASGERSGEKRSDADGLACESRVRTFSNSIRGSRSREEHEDSDAVQLQRLAEKLREQETEKRLMQEDSFQLEQMLKRQYFQDIQRKEAEKEELQQQLAHTQQLGNSLRQRLTDVTHQKNQLYDIVMLAQDALAEAVASAPWSPRQLRSSRGTPVSPRVAGRAARRAACSAGGAAAGETYRALAREDGAEEVNDEDHSEEAEVRISSEEEREEEEALKKLLASREEVSHTLATLVDKLKRAVEVLDTHELARDEEAALSASLRRAVVACNLDEGEVKALSKEKEESPGIISDVPSDDSKADSQQGEESILSDEEKDGETAQQLRQLQEEVNVLRKNLRSFTDAVLATQKQQFAGVGKTEGSGDATELTPEKGQRSVSVCVGSGEMVPPQKLMLQRLEELQMLNAKLLLDNTELHRLCAQQMANSPGACPSKVTHSGNEAYTTSAVSAAVANQTATARLHPVEGSPSNQKLPNMSKDIVMCSYSPLKDNSPVVRSEVAAPRVVHESAATFSPVSAASPATSASAAPHRIPYCVTMSSPVVCHTPASFFSYDGGGFNFLGDKLAGSAAGASAVEAAGAVVGRSYNAVHTKRSSFTDGGRTAPAVDATEISGESRCMSPQLLPPLRRELWKSPGLANPTSGLNCARPYQKQEHISMQACLRHEDSQQTQGRSTLEQAGLYGEEIVHVGEPSQQAFTQQNLPEPPPRIFQQPLLFQTSPEQLPLRTARLVDRTISSLPPRTGAAENVTVPQAYSVQHFERQRLHSQRGRQGGSAPSAAYTAAERAFPRLPQYLKSGRPQGSQQETGPRPAITPSSSASRLPLLRSFASGSGAAQTQRQRVRALSSVGSGVDRRLPVTQSLTLLRQGNPAAQSQRKLHSRSHSQLITAEADNPRLDANVAPAALYREVSPLSTDNRARIDLTVWGQRVTREEKTLNRGAANAGVGGGRAAGATVAGRQATDGIPAKVFLRTRRASAVVSADYFPALTPAHSDSRLLATSEDRHRRQQRGSCALGRCWLGFSAAVDKASEATHHVPQASNPRLRPSHATKYIQPFSSKTQAAARLRPLSPVTRSFCLTKDHMSSPGSGLPGRDSIEGVQPRVIPTAPLSPPAGSAATPNNSLFALKASPVVIPFHNSGMSYAHHHTLASSAPAVGLPRMSRFPYSQGPSPLSPPSFAAPAVSSPAGLHVPSVCFTPAPAAVSPALSSTSQVLYDKVRESNFCRESVAPQPRLTTCWIGEAPKVYDKIPVAQELWQTRGVA